MRTSLNKIQAIEEYLNTTMPFDERLLFEARKIADQNLAQDVVAQEQTYQLIAAYSRAVMRKDLESLHYKLMNDPAKRSFRELILSIFQKH